MPIANEDRLVVPDDLGTIPRSEKLGFLEHVRSQGGGLATLSGQVLWTLSLYIWACRQDVLEICCARPGDGSGDRLLLPFGHNS